MHPRIKSHDILFYQFKYKIQNVKQRTGKPESP